MFFLPLIGGYCTLFAVFHGQNVVGIGHLRDDDCIVHILTPKEGEFEYEGHMFKIRHIPNGAAVQIDDEPEVILVDGTPA